MGRSINERYEAFDVLGRGGQGVVYRALDRWTAREVAVKVLASKAAREPQTAERLIREQRALSALKGTAAVEVLDICRGNEGELCLVMELLKGKDLESHLYEVEDRNERIPLSRIAEIFDPIVDTLETAHDTGILHRDLKPANVFLLEDGSVRLLDFGMARLVKAAPLTAAGTVMGSPSFMAPEAWSGQSELVDQRADVYSLGVILFRVLAGDLPFAGTSLQQKFLGATRAVRPSLVAKRPDLPREADDWVAVALAIDREQRFRNVRALWSSFLRTFDVKRPKRPDASSSLWALAKHAVRRMAGAAEAPSAAGAQSPEPALLEPSFGTEALARSVLHWGAPVPLAPDAKASAPRQKQPSRAAAPPSSAVERTLELTESDLVAMPPTAPSAAVVEKTLELEEDDLQPAEDTLPEPPVAPWRPGRGG